MVTKSYQNIQPIIKSLFQTRNFVAGDKKSMKMEDDVPDGIQARNVNGFTQRLYNYDRKQFKQV